MNKLLLSFMILITWLPTSGQSEGQQFNDDLLDHMIGQWNVSVTAHGFVSTGTYEASWVLNHQHLNIHFKGKDIVPWIGTPMEFQYFIGYKHAEKKYVVHEMTVFGSDGFEGFCYAFRNGNEIKLLQKDVASSDTTIVQTITWQPASKSWHILSWPEGGGKSGEVFLEMQLTQVKPRNRGASYPKR